MRSPKGLKRKPRTLNQRGVHKAKALLRLKPEHALKHLAQRPASASRALRALSKSPEFAFIVCQRRTFLSEWHRRLRTKESQ